MQNFKLGTFTTTYSKWHHVLQSNSPIIFPKLLSDFLSRCGMHSCLITRAFPTTPQFDTLSSCRKNPLSEIPHRQVKVLLSPVFPELVLSISNISTACGYDVSAMLTHQNVTEQCVTSLVFDNFLTEGEHATSCIYAHGHSAYYNMLTTTKYPRTHPCTHPPTHPRTHPDTHPLTHPPTHPYACSHVYIHLTSLFQLQLPTSRKYLTI